MAGSGFQNTQNQTPTGYYKISFHNIVKSMTSTDFAKEKITKNEEFINNNQNLTKAGSMNLYKSLDTDKKKLNTNKKQISKNNTESTNTKKFYSSSYKQIGTTSYKSRGTSKETNKISKKNIGGFNNNKKISSQQQNLKKYAKEDSYNIKFTSDNQLEKDYQTENHHLAESDYMIKCRTR